MLLSALGWAGRAFRFGLIRPNLTKSSVIPSIVPVTHATFNCVGRHRNDPRGTGQVLAIAGAVLLVLALVVLGGFFLYRSVTGTGAASMPGGDEETMADTETEEELGALHMRVTGSSVDILVRIAGGEVLTDTTMSTGEYVTFDESQLEVTLSDPGAVEVLVHGEPHDMDPAETPETDDEDENGNDEYTFSVRDGEVTE